jgi:hypothetical protein
MTVLLLKIEELVTFRAVSMTNPFLNPLTLRSKTEISPAPLYKFDSIILKKY